jgi:hypothetical protein
MLLMKRLLLLLLLLLLKLLLRLLLLLLLLVDGLDNLGLRRMPSNSGGVLSDTKRYSLE